MRRKIIGLGANSYVISLPSKWVRDKGLGKKDEIDLLETKDTLIIRPVQKRSKQSIPLTITESNKNSIKNFMLVLNSLGYDEVIVHYENKDLLQTIYDISSLNTGFALVEQSKDRVIFRTLVGEVEEDIDSLIERIFKITVSLANSFYDTVQSSRWKDLKGLISLEKTNNQTTAYCQRLLIKNGYKETNKTCFAYMLIWNLEQIADFYKLSCHLLSDKSKKIKLMPKTIELIDKTNNSLEKLYESYKVMNPEQYHEIFHMKLKIGQEIEEVMRKGSFEDIAMGHYLLDLTTYIQDCATVCLALSAHDNVE